MTELTRTEALRLLALPPWAEPDEVKRAFRRLAREHHPDLGGDAATFDRLHQAYELLAGAEGTGPPEVSRGRPSRDAPAAERTDLDIATIDWARPVPARGQRLDRDLLAIHLASAEPIATAVATSRAPGSHLNRFAEHLGSDTAARLRVAPGADDRRRPVVAVELTAWSRRGRRALEAATLGELWVRHRSPSSTTLAAALPRDGDARVLAARATLHVERLLEQLDWQLPAWTLTAPEA